MKIENIKNKIKKIVGIENVEFLNHTKNYFSADLFLVGINFISIPIFTRFLSPAEYGLIAVFTALISIAKVVMGLNLHAGIKRYYFDRTESFPQALGTNIVFSFMLALVILLSLVLNTKMIASVLNIDEQLFSCVILVSFLTIPFQILLNYYQAIKDSKINSTLSIIRSVSIVSLAIVFIILFKEDKYMGRVYSELLVSSVMFLYSSYFLYKLANFSSLAWKYLKYTLYFSVPLIPHTISGFVLSYFDRIVIQQLSNSTDSGLYSFAYNVGMLMNILVMASSKSWNPIFLEEMKKSNLKKINNIAFAYSNYIYFAAIGLILFSKELVMILADQKYYVSLGIIPIIVVSYVFVFLYTLYFQYAFHRRKTSLISINTFLAGAFNIALNYWLIPIYGYVAAAYNTLFSFALLFVLHYCNARFILKEKVIPLKLILPRFLFVISVGILNCLLLGSMETYAVVLMIKILVLLISGYFLIIKTN